MFNGALHCKSGDGISKLLFLTSYLKKHLVYLLGKTCMLAANRGLNGKSVRFTRNNRADLEVKGS